MKTVAIVGVILIVIGLWLGGSYNSLVSKSEAVTSSWAQVETQYQRRFDLVPNLVSATKGTLSQEREVFTAIAEARTRYAGAPAGTGEQVEATAQYESALSRLLVVMENYPELKSNTTVIGLMDELSGTENRVLVARDRYNEQVRSYNVMVKRFPRSVIANMFGFEEKEFFASVENANVVPVVNLEL